MPLSWRVDDELPHLAESLVGLVAGEQRIGRLVCRREPVRLDQQGAGAAQHEHRIVGVGGAGGHDRVGGDARLRREQRQQRLVFHLAEPAEPDR